MRPSDCAMEAKARCAARRAHTGCTLTDDGCRTRTDRMTAGVTPQLGEADTEDGAARCVIPVVIHLYGTALTSAPNVEAPTRQRTATEPICTAISAGVADIQKWSASRKNPGDLHGKNNEVDPRAESEPIGHLGVGASAQMTAPRVMTPAGTGRRKEAADSEKDADSTTRGTRRSAHGRSNVSHQHQRRQTKQRLLTRSHR